MKVAEYKQLINYNLLCPFNSAAQSINNYPWLLLSSSGQRRQLQLWNSVACERCLVLHMATARKKLGKLTLGGIFLDFRPF